MKRMKLFLPLIIFAVLALFLMRGLKLDPSAMPSALLNKPWPVFSLHTLDANDSISEKNLRGQKALVNIWATWCVTCRVEHPFLMQLQQQGITIYSVNYKDNQADAKNWLQEKGNPYRFTIVDADGKLGIDLGVFGAPETYFIDAQGVIRYKHVGDLNERVWNEKLKAVWDQL
ncbi:MAG TPA: DsbE family thiol:disulfide interchange protein [Pseudomonadales bacterium]|nr:DsbE family thiol:disulfide interchange protein [Pseudomonadales bacterium]